MKLLKRISAAMFPCAQRLDAVIAQHDEACASLKKAVENGGKEAFRKVVEHGFAKAQG